EVASGNPDTAGSIGRNRECGPGDKNRDDDNQATDMANQWCALMKRGSVGRLRDPDSAPPPKCPIGVMGHLDYASRLRGPLWPVTGSSVRSIAPRPPMTQPPPRVAPSGPRSVSTPHWSGRLEAGIVT